MRVVFYVLKKALRSILAPAGFEQKGKGNVTLHENAGQVTFTQITNNINVIVANSAEAEAILREIPLVFTPSVEPKELPKG